MTPMSLLFQVLEAHWVLSAAETVHGSCSQTAVGASMHLDRINICIVRW